MSEANLELARVSCPFCELSDDDCIFVGPTVRVIWDRYPVSRGHALILPRRHVSSWFDATAEEQTAILMALTEVHAAIKRQFSPDGYNVGLNDGSAAGQTVEHLHLHVIPRFRGDVADARGGIRSVIPGKADYLAPPSEAAAPHARALVGGGDDPFLPHLISHIDGAIRVDLAVAFIMESGVRLISEHLRDVVARGGKVRILTGDYFGVTEPDALLHLRDLGDGIELRVFESAGGSFHPKSYILHGALGQGTAFIGSSNLSRTALGSGIEWNFRVVTARDDAGFRDACDAFELLLQHAQVRAVDADWIEAYRKRRVPATPLITGIPLELPAIPPAPNFVQVEALAALERTRVQGNTAGLVVLATGLGKTWLGAFDTTRTNAGRVLFVAHRDEILDQALRTFRIIRPQAVLGKYTGQERVERADVLFASIQTLGQQRHLDRFPADYFDYIIIDEFHHAAAATYRRLLDHFTPQFLLGLTATPERTDGADLLTLCGDNLVYRCDLPDGIRRGLLAQFDYYGVPDEVDYENIPWRNSRFDEEELTNKLATTSRAENALDQLQRRGGSKALAFCVSQRHADFMARYFHEAGLRAVAVHSGPGSAPRAASLEGLQRGDLDVLCAVDMFNEGVDLPDVDTVMMLRPTESRILWLQQFGRGLRYREGKRLKVIDYIGNHRTFLLKPQALFQLGSGQSEIAYALRLLDEGNIAELLPPGCSVTYDLEAKEILRSLLAPTAPREALESYYREFRERSGIRPTASEVYQDGLDPKSARAGFGTWFQFVRSMGDLTGAADDAEVRLRSFLEALEVTPMTKSYKMLVLLAMLAEGGFPDGLEIARLMNRIRIIARRSAALRSELGDSLDNDEALRHLLESNPISAWTAGAGTGGERYFRYDSGRFGFATSIAPSLGAAAAELVRELAEWRLANYLRRTGQSEGAPRIFCRVSHSNGRPILFLPSRDRTPGIPKGWVEITADGEPYQANFVQIAINAVTRPGATQNVLPDILHKWFGTGAGQPGTSHAVVFQTSPAGYTVAPAGDEAKKRPQLWTRHKRADVPKLFGFEFRGREAQSGVVIRPGLTLLFVTLDKSTAEEAHKYKDEFLSPTEFQWQSQNRTKPDSKAGREIADHRALNRAIYLFVRAQAKVRGRAESFIYCGELTFDHWEIGTPITVWWRLEASIPRALWNELRVPEQ